jgi:hypothetical protein
MSDVLQRCLYIYILTLDSHSLTLFVTEKIKLVKIRNFKHLIDPVTCHFEKIKENNEDVYKFFFYFSSNIAV